MKKTSGDRTAKELLSISPLFAMLIILTVAAGVLSGCSAGVSEADHEAVVSENDSLRNDHSILQNEHSALVAEKAELQIIHDSLLVEMVSLQGEYDVLYIETADFRALGESQRADALEVATLVDGISTLESRVGELNTEIGELNNRITTLQSDVVRIAGESRAIPAGVWYVGSDIEAGRYRVYGGSSNFFVRRNEFPVVNIILGTAMGVSEYIFTFRNGDEIDARSSFRMVPIE